jgi:hypothetical protein
MDFSHTYEAGRTTETVKTTLLIYSGRTDGPWTTLPFGFPEGPGEHVVLPVQIHDPVLQEI